MFRKQERILSSNELTKPRDEMNILTETSLLLPSTDNKAGERQEENLILIYYLTVVRILCLCFTAHKMIVIILELK